MVRKTAEAAGPPANIPPENSQVGTRAGKPAKDPPEKALACGIGTLAFRNQRAVHVSAALLLEAEGFLGDQPGQIGFDGLGVPGRVGARQGLDDLPGGAGGLGPNHLHDLPFRFRDARDFFHVPYRLRL